MDTNKAKNAVIIMLVILNTVIFQLIRQKENTFTLTSARYDVILDVLKNNRISLLSNIVNTDFSPKSQLIMSHYSIDIIESMLPGRLFTFMNGTFQISVPRIDEPIPITEREAIQKCEEFLLELAETSGIDLQFTLVDTRPEATGFRILYMGSYNGIPIASNIIEFTLDGRGIYNLTFRLAVPEGFADSTHMIFAKDEALLRFLREMRELYPHNSIHIHDITITYYSTVDNHNEISPARPAYMVTFNIIDFPEGPLKSHAFIDAYNNRIITNIITNNGIFSFSF